MFLYAPAQVVKPNSDTSHDLMKMLTSCVPKARLFPYLSKYFNIPDSKGTVAIRSLVGKVKKVHIEHSVDRSVTIAWVQGSLNPDQILIIGMDESTHQIYMVDCTPSRLPSVPEYGDLDVWLPLSGRRVLYWNSGDSRIDIFGIDRVFSKGFKGFGDDFFKSATPVELNSNYDKSLLAPYEFKLDSKYQKDYRVFKLNRSLIFRKDGFCDWE